MTLRVHSLNIYPVKSCRGFTVSSAELINTGFRYDRRWMLVDGDGNFLSQRQIAQMTLINTRLQDKSLICSFGNDELEIPLDQDQKSSPQRGVTIWNDQCTARIVSNAASQWFSEKLNTECELVYQPDNERRLVDTDYAHDQETVSFADGFPLLVLSLESLQALNERLNQPVSIERFRPNIVIQGAQPHDEDNWKSITTGDITIDLVKPCSRCVIPSIDPDNANRHPDLLKVLASYCRHEGKVYFGMNGLHRSTGQVDVGATVNVNKI